MTGGIAAAFQPPLTASAPIVSLPSREGAEGRGDAQKRSRSTSLSPSPHHLRLNLYPRHAL
jgi:hypothetical protein